MVHVQQDACEGLRTGRLQIGNVGANPFDGQVAAQAWGYEQDAEAV